MIPGGKEGGGRLFTTRFAALIAAAWTILVFANWLEANPISLGKIGRAVAAYGWIRPGPAFSAAGRHLVNVVLALLLAGAAFGAGSPALEWLGVRASRRSGMMRAALGAGVISFVVLGTGFCGLLYSGLAWVCAAAAAAYSLRLIKPLSFGWAFTSKTWPLSVIGLAALWTALLGNLAPEISYDSLVHHLAHPMRYAAFHRIFAMPYHFLSHYPALVEMQYLLAILLGKSAQSAKLVHFMYGILTLSILVSWAREKLEDHWVLAGAAAFLLIPYVQIVMMWSYVDLAAAAFLTLSLISALQSRVNPFLLGVFCGLCAGTKVTGIFAPALALPILLIRRSSRWTILAFAAVFSVVVCPWGLKNFLIAGNPVAPFFSSVVPTLSWGEENQSRYDSELRSYGDRDAGGVLTSLFSLPWRTSVRNAGVLDTKAGMGAWFVWAFPFLLLGGGPAGWAFALAAAGYFLLWILIPHQVRYLLPIWPVAIIAALHAVRALAARGGTALVPVWAGGAALLISFGAAIERQHFVTIPLPVVFGLETPAMYLARGAPGKPYSLRAAKWLRENAGDERGLIISNFGMGMLWGPKAVFQSAFDTPLIERYSKESRDLREIGKKMKQAGFAYAMYSQGAGFLIQAAYGTYNFDRSSALRWRDYWSACPVPARSWNDQFLYYRLGKCGRGAGNFSSLPGVDEQFLGPIDKRVQEAEGKGLSPEDFRRFAEEYRAAARDSISPCALERAGAALLKSGDVAGAVTTLREAERRGRSTAIFHDAAGVAESLSGNQAQAIRHFKSALILDSDLGDARRNLAVILTHLGREREALELMKEGSETEYLQERNPFSGGR